VALLQNIETIRQKYFKCEWAGEKPRLNGLAERDRSNAVHYWRLNQYKLQKLNDFAQIIKNSLTDGHTWSIIFEKG
jgi:hypothetical protein